MTQPSQTPTSEGKTSIDALIELLSEKGKTDLNTVSIALGVSPTILEEWAKVLENGNLVKISYEVGKMYLEPLGAGAGTEQGRSAAMRVEAQRAALQSEAEVEKIMLDKFSKTLDELSATAAGMEALYRQKLPGLQKLFSELDAMSAPMAQRTKDLAGVQKSAGSYFGQLDKRVDALYAKIDALEGATEGKALKQKEEMLRGTLSRADAAKATLLDLEDTRQALYGKISLDIDRQVKEFKTGLKASLDQVYAELRADAAEASNIDKQIRAELAETMKTAADAGKLKKEAEAAKADLMASRNTFKVSYQSAVGELEKSSTGVDQRYQVAQRQLDELKASMGEAARLHDSAVSVRAELDSIQKTIVKSRADVSLLVESLKTLDTMSKKMGQSEKAKAVTELNKKSMDIKMTGEKIGRSLDKADDSIEKQAEGKR